VTDTADPYENPLLYDLEYQDYTKDIRYYVQLCKHLGTSVLEFGCGNGRLSIPIATAGVELWGVDLSKSMLEHLREKLATLGPTVQGRVRTIQADFLTYKPPRPFPLVIIPFNALHHCTDLKQIREMATAAHRALVPEGYLALDCYLIDKKLYNRGPDERYEPRWFTHPQTGEQLYSWEQSWWEEASHTHHVTYCYQHPDGHVEQTHLDLHMYERSALRDVVDSCGFKLFEEWSDFQSGPVGPNDHKWVAIFRRRN
jgi:SAM-dependent methyltransferase